MHLILKRRLAEAGLPKILSPHSFRALMVTDLRSQNVSFEGFQYLAGRIRPRATPLYDRRHHSASRKAVEQISV